MMPRDTKIRSLVSDFGMPEDVAAESIDTLEASAESSPMTLLQPMQLGSGGQFMQFRMGPNYEMALFVAQVTGSVIVTDSETRWIEFQSAQHREMGNVSYPWDDIYARLKRMPLDYQMLESYTKTQHHFTATRIALKKADELILGDIRDNIQLESLTESVTRLNSRLDHIDSDRTAEFMNGDCKILAPEGGIYDRNVQRLLVRSGCMKYDRKVRSVYYVGLKL